MTRKEDSERTILKEIRGMTLIELFSVDVDMFFHILKIKASSSGEDYEDYRAGLRDSFNKIVQQLAIAEFGKDSAARRFTALRCRNKEIDDMDAEFNFRNDL